MRNQYHHLIISVHLSKCPTMWLPYLRIVSRHKPTFLKLLTFFLLKVLLINTFIAFPCDLLFLNYQQEQYKSAPSPMAKLIWLPPNCTARSTWLRLRVLSSRAWSHGKQCFTRPSDFRVGLCKWEQCEDLGILAGGSESWTEGAAQCKALEPQSAGAAASWCQYAGSPGSHRALEGIPEHTGWQITKLASCWLQHPRKHCRVSFFSSFVQPYENQQP